MESELSDSDKASSVLSDEEEEEAVPRRGRPARSSFGLRVAFQFPNKKMAKTPDRNSSHVSDSKPDLGREKSCRQAKEKEDSASESEDDSKAESQEHSDALLKRAMNIKENKAMVSPCRGLGPQPAAVTVAAQHCSLGEGALGTSVPCLALVWEQKDSRTVSRCSEEAGCWSSCEACYVLSW